MATLDDIAAALVKPAQRVVYEGAPRASVAVVVVPGLDLLMISRAAREGDPWSGHVAFPGGRMQAGDETPLHAAIRETHEEIGVDLSGARVLGELDEVPTVHPLPPLLVRPYVFALDRVPAVQPNHEVAAVHRFPLDDLLAGRGRGRMSRVFRDVPWVLPYVDHDGVRLWGLTLRMVDDLLDRIDGRGLGLDRPEIRGQDGSP